MRTTVILLLLAASTFADVFKKKIKVGKKLCMCNFNLIAAGTKLSPKSKVSCDKKCSGVAKRVSLEGDTGVFTFDMKVVKGKVVLSKGSVKLATTTGATETAGTNGTTGTTGESPVPIPAGSGLETTA